MWPEAALILGAYLFGALPVLFLMGKLKGVYLIGVIDSVAFRKDEQAVEALQTIICEGNQSVAAAAIAALGRMGGTVSD